MFVYFTPEFIRGKFLKFKIMFGVTLYGLQNTKQFNDFNANYITLKTFNGLMYEPQNLDLLRPIITIRFNNQGDLTTFLNRGTHFFIAVLKRYYIITKYEILRPFTLKLYGFIDVIHTYKDNIKRANVTLIQSENTNKFLSNSNNLYDIRPKFERLNFSRETPFANIENNIILITTKGNI